MHTALHFGQGLRHIFCLQAASQARTSFHLAINQVALTMCACSELHEEASSSRVCLTTTIAGRQSRMLLAGILKAGQLLLCVQLHGYNQEGMLIL